MPLFFLVFSLFLQSRCPLCQRSTSQVFCRACHQQLQQQRLSDPTEFWTQSPPLFVWGEYSGSLKRTIATLKYDHQRHLSRPLGEWMAQAWLNSPLRSRRSLILPIPLHAERRKSRGFNQAELLARSFCQLTGCVLKPNGLRRVRATEALFNLSKSAREQMLKDVFVVDRALRSDSVMLFDDIYTTGATVRSAMQALHQQGIQVEGVIVLAKTPAR